MWCDTRPRTGYIYKTSPSSPTRPFLSQCQLLESQFEHYQKAKEKGQADLTSFSTVTFSACLIYQDALAAYPRCSKCG